MNEIEQLRADIATLEAAQAEIARVSKSNFPPGYFKEIKEIAIVTELKQKLAQLEAVAAAKADPHKDAKKLADFPWSDGTTQRVLSDYVRHLEQIVAELENQLNPQGCLIGCCDCHMERRCNWLEAKVAELEAELSKRPVVWVAKCVNTGLYASDNRGILLFTSKAAAATFWLICNPEPYTGEQK